MQFRRATAQDIAALNLLVNRAYRPAAGEGGWTHESALVAGARISAQQVGELFTPDAAVLLLRQQGEIVACVHVQADGPDAAGIGMLASEPRLQAQGLGKQMLQHAEQFALQQLGARILRMSVLSSRPELLAFYERRGYQRTGELESYPLTAGVGQPLRADLHLLMLEKRAG